MKIEISALKNDHYLMVDKLKHSELSAFLNEKLKQEKKWFFYIYLLMLISPLSYLSFLITKYSLTEELSVIQCFIYVAFGIITSILFIPIHEMIHYVGYKIAGAKSISFYTNLKKFYFATVADKFITNLNEFAFIAILPFSLVLIGVALSFPFLEAHLQIAVIAFFFVHNIFCSGDFILLNYLAINKGMMTYDDQAQGETYFYIRKQISDTKPQ